MSSPDPRVGAFCNPHGPDVFAIAAQAHQVWEPDPFDVESIHPEARAVFARLIDRVTTPICQDHGRILLVLGASGSGKTHLMRAFRDQVHGRFRGYAGYMQMSSDTSSYARYLLANLIDSLQRPYAPHVPAWPVHAPALLCLSRTLLRDAGDPAATAALCQGALPHEQAVALVDALADRLLADERYRDIDPDLARALLHLQRGEPAVGARVHKYLRCEDLGARDRALLGHLVPRTQDEDPLRMVVQLGRLMWQAEQACLVLLVDQLEGIFNLDESRERFRRALDVLHALVDHLPSAVVVIACLADFYGAHKPELGLATPILDRLERDPEPVSLASTLGLEQVEALVGRRLQSLYGHLAPGDQAGAGPAFPLDRVLLAQLAALRPRDVLDWCRRYRRQCIEAGALVPAPRVERPVAPPREREIHDLERMWNDFHAEHEPFVPEGEGARLELLAWAAQARAAELDPAPRVATRSTEQGLEMRIAGNGQVQFLAVALCNQDPRGGHLGDRLRALVTGARDRGTGAAGAVTPVAVRHGPFPDGPKTTEQLDALARAGGRQVIMGEGDWRTIMALRAFSDAHRKQPLLGDWQRAMQPLGRLASLRALLDQAVAARMPVAAGEAAAAGTADRQAAATGNTDRQAAATGTAVRAPGARASARPAMPAPDPAAPLILGRIAPYPEPSAEHLATLDPAALRRHAAIVGSSGSGKTTLALALVEQLLLRGVAVLVIDRKGDLCRYADPAWWAEDAGAPDRRARKALLRDRVDVRVYTPGAAHGRPLSIPVVPPDLAELPAGARGEVARHAARALGAMLGLRDKANDRARLAVLSQAIELLGVAEGTGAARATIDQLIDLLHGRDPALVELAGLLGDRHYARLVDELSSLRILRRHLFEEGDARLAAGALLAAAPGRTSLAILSTKFLDDGASVDFWVARLLIEIQRWASKHPADHLQAALLLDEADIYLPAVGKPATKEPLESLLRRGRSAGLGVLLATQNPGDLDYRARDNVDTWLVGKVTQRRAMDKLAALLGDAPASELASQGPGQFVLLHGNARTPLMADRALMEPAQLAEEDILRIARGT